MKLSRSYLLGLGSGLILSALIAMVLPTGSIKLTEDGAPVKKQETPQSDNAVSSPSGTSLESSINDEAFIQKPKSGKTANEESLTPDQLFTIPAGASAEKIAELLVSGHWITNKEEFLSFVKQKNLASKFKAGSYKLTSGMSLDEIMNQLIK